LLETLNNYKFLFFSQVTGVRNGDEVESVG